MWVCFRLAVVAAFCLSCSCALCESNDGPPSPRVYSAVSGKREAVAEQVCHAAVKGASADQLDNCKKAQLDALNYLFERIRHFFVGRGGDEYKVGLQAPEELPYSDWSPLKAETLDSSYTHYLIAKITAVLEEPTGYEDWVVRVRWEVGRFGTDSTGKRSLVYYSELPDDYDVTIAISKGSGGSGLKYIKYVNHDWLPSDGIQQYAELVFIGLMKYLPELRPVYEIRIDCFTGIEIANDKVDDILKRALPSDEAIGFISILADEMTDGDQSPPRWSPKFPPGIHKFSQLFAKQCNGSDSDPSSSEVNNDARNAWGLHLESLNANLGPRYEINGSVSWAGPHEAAAPPLDRIPIRLTIVDTGMQGSYGKVVLEDETTATSELVEFNRKITLNVNAAKATKFTLRIDGCTDEGAVRANFEDHTVAKGLASDIHEAASEGKATASLDPRWSCPAVQ
jgi:hypothetical protein